MDQDGLFLVLSMCNACRTAKGSWKKCMGKRHNPKLSTVSQENLTFAHRQCVKPDQTMTIYKLRNRETNEELLEFSEDIVFQTPCPSCTSIKGCLKAGHRLQDWKPIFNDTPIGAPLPNGDAAGGGGEDEETPLGTAKGSGSVKSSSVGSGAPGGSLSSGGRGKRNDKGMGGARGGAGSGAVGAKAGNGRASSASVSGSASAGDVSHNLSGTPKLPHKRKSPGPAVSPPAKASNVVTPKSSSSSSSQKSMKGLQKETNAKRSSKDKKSTPSEIGGNGHRILGLPKLELDDVHAASDRKERPLKRRNRHGVQAAGAATPTCGAVGSNSHGTIGASKVEGKSISSGGGDVGNKKPKIVASPENGEAAVNAVRNREIDGTKGVEVKDAALTQRRQRDQQSQEQDQQQQRGREAGQGVRQAREERPERVPKAREPERRKTIAERLEDVKAEESKLLVEFEATHKKCEKEEEAKRAEMIEFHRAGEAAIREIKKMKEEALCWIASRRQKIAAERQSLVKLRMKELEAEQERARRDAQEREEKLEAEKKALTEAWSKQDSARPERSDPWHDGWSSSSIFDLAKIPSVDVRGRVVRHKDASDALAPKNPCEGGVESASNSSKVISGAAVDGSKSNSGHVQSQQSAGGTDTSDGCDAGCSVATGSKSEAPMSVCNPPAGEASTGGVGVGVELASRSANTSMVDGKALVLPPEAKTANPREEERGSWSVGPARLANAIATPVTSTAAPSGGGASGDKNLKGSLVCAAPASNRAGAATDGAAVQKERGSEGKATKADPVKDKVGADSNELAVRASKGVVPMVGRPGVAAR